MNKKSISKKDADALARLNEVWGDDKDGEYEKLYNRHKNLKSKATKKSKKK